jgi:hypothetical protein
MEPDVLGTKYNKIAHWWNERLREIHGFLIS